MKCWEWGLISSVTALKVLILKNGPTVYRVCCKKVSIYGVIMNFRVARGKIIISRETFFKKQTLPIFNLEKFTLTSSYEVFHNCETKQKSRNTILKCTSRRLLCEKRRLNMDFPHKL